ncbi:hypothetical protein [Tessaracoccus massiliensis]|uniref:hypothetical protein n=1 Tax=Tessaracoccus massiliensis TaxID=1522311 RepID=UPI00058B2AC1|nr:hypothetical protein [Tessaracoccus massiliensis]
MALFTDESVETIVPAALTAGHREANTKSFPDLVEYLPWVPDEWDLIGSGTDALEDVARAVRPLAADVEDMNPPGRGDRFIEFARSRGL